MILAVPLVHTLRDHHVPVWINSQLVCPKQCSSCSDSSTCSTCNYSSPPSCHCSSSLSLTNSCDSTCSLNDWSISTGNNCRSVPSSFQLRHSISTASIVEEGPLVLSHSLHPSASLSLNVSSTLATIPHLRTGFSLSLWLALDDLSSSQDLLNFFGNVGLSFSSTGSFVLTVS